jgi:transcriptional regulator with GAF, ATPase, and Fis domain
MQVKLLRVLQNRCVERLGGTTTIPVDLRVLAGSKRDLRAMVAEGRFREDLFYRLNVIPIDLPPLRERRDDIPLLATAFTTRLALRLRRRIDPLSDAEVSRLTAYDWPGNIRELQNVLERAVITSVDGRLNLERALPALSADASTRQHTPSSTSKILTAEDLADLERQNLLRALKRADWRVAGPGGAAALLGLRPSTLTSRMKALGVTKKPVALPRQLPLDKSRPSARDLAS